MDERLKNLIYFKFYATDAERDELFSWPPFWCGMALLVVVLLLLCFAMDGCRSYRRGAPARIPGCQAPVIAERGCKSVQFTDRVEVWCDGQKRWTYRCHA